VALDLNGKPSHINACSNSVALVVDALQARRNAVTFAAILASTAPTMAVHPTVPSIAAHTIATPGTNVLAMEAGASQRT